MTKKYQRKDWVNRLTRAGKRPSTVRNAYFVVRQVLAQAVVDGRIGSNPCEHVTLPKTTAHNGSVEHSATTLGPQQVDALADELPWPYDVLVLLAAWTGLRAGEIAGLQVQDVDLLRSRLHVRRTVIDLNGPAHLRHPKVPALGPYGAADEDPCRGPGRLPCPAPARKYP